MSEQDDREARARAIAEADALIERLRPMLAGQAPEVVGAALAYLTTLWLRGHHPLELRDRLWRVHQGEIAEATFGGELEH